MTMTTSFKLPILLAALVFNVAAQGAQFNLRVQSSDPASEQNFKIQQEWVRDVEQKSQGRIKIQLLPVGSVTGNTQTLSAISKGDILDGHLTATEYFGKIDPALGLMGNFVGAWSDTSQLLDYINNGGGYQLMNEIYAPYNIKFVGGSTTGVESLVASVPLDKVSDLKGVKMRTPGGLVSAIFGAAGAVPLELGGNEVMAALKDGRIQAADYTVFSTNQKAGFNDVAHHPLYPGFHSLPLIEMSLNLSLWNKMPRDLQDILSQSVKDFAVNITSQLKVADAAAVAEAKRNPKITIHNWNDAERKKFRAIALQQWREYTKKSPNSRKVFISVDKYLIEHHLLDDWFF